MSSKILLIICSAATLTSCVSHLHNHRILECKNVVIVVEKEKETQKYDINSLVRAVDFEQLQVITKQAIAEKEISYATYFHTKKVLYKEEKICLLNNISRYNDKSPVLNKNDSFYTKKLNILVCALLLNHERPHIRSPGYYI